MIRGKVETKFELKQRYIRDGNLDLKKLSKPYTVKQIREALAKFRSEK